MSKEKPKGPSFHFVPSAGDGGKRMKQIKDILRSTLGQYIVASQIEEAVDVCVSRMKPLLKLAPEPNKGATVMTEAAAHRNEKSNTFHARPKTL